MERREFLKKVALAGVAGGALGAAGCGKEETSSKSGSTPAVTGKKFEWKMVTTWPPHFPVLGESADFIAKWCEEMSGGRLKIKVYGGNELVPPMETFDTVRRGNVQMGHAASYYWAGHSAALQFFSAVPFGMNAQQMNAWLYSGGGLQLWEEVYSDFNLVPFPAGNSGVQMGGWFNRKIDTLDDFQGLKMRMPGLGGKVIAKAGATVALYPGAELYTNLERGVIDATEWVGPYHDFKMGFHKIAKYYYYPGWHEPGTVIECMVNKKAWESLPSDLQNIVRAACARSNLWMVGEFEAKNKEYLDKILKLDRVEVLPYPDPVLAGLRKHTDAVIAELTEKDELSAKVFGHFDAFRKQVGAWARISEMAYHNKIVG